MSEYKIKAGITIGDPNGIGCEVIIKMLSDSRMTELFTPVIYGSAKILSYYKNIVEQADDFHYTVISSARDARPKRINLINCCGEDVKITPGVATSESGAAALGSLRRAVEDLKDGLTDVLVTAPVNKENIQCGDFRFAGHTDYLAAEFGTEPIMIMCGEKLKVGLVTTHVPLSEVSPLVSKERIVSRLESLRHSLIKDFGFVQPRIAVLSLNPHAGDGGLIGDEEMKVIKPAVREAVGNGVIAFGPFAADGFFGFEEYVKYDAVLAMYHDQGLIPFKMLCPDGVNFTAGLPIVRTSPAHGVAYDIAGKGIADPSSMREAVYAAIDIFRNRAGYAEMTKNPLKRFERERGADISVNDLPQEPEIEH